jgi:hypothetical protein
MLRQVVKIIREVRQKRVLIALGAYPLQMALLQLRRRDQTLEIG